MLSLYGQKYTLSSRDIVVRNVGGGAGVALLCAEHVGKGRVVWCVSKYIHLYISIEGQVQKAVCPWCDLLSH